MIAFAIVPHQAKTSQPFSTEKIGTYLADLKVGGSMIPVSVLVKRNHEKPIPIFKPNLSVHEVIKDMTQSGIEAALIMDKDKILGIFSERDCMRPILLNGIDSRDLRVEDAMTKDVYCIGSNSLLDECLSVMSANNIGYLPVIDGSVLVDFISMKEVVEVLVDDRDFLIEQLVRYITGNQFTRRPLEQSLFLNKKTVIDEISLIDTENVYQMR
jgi:CBS domain-containing protein